MFLPFLVGDEPIPALIFELPPESFDAARRQGERAPGLPGLCVPAPPDRTPHSDARRLRRLEVRPTLEEDVVPGEGPQFLGPGTSQQRDDDLRVHRSPLGPLQHRFSQPERMSTLDAYARGLADVPTPSGATPRQLLPITEVRH